MRVVEHRALWHLGFVPLQSANQTPKPGRSRYIAAMEMRPETEGVMGVHSLMVVYVDLCKNSQFCRFVSVIF